METAPAIEDIWPTIFIGADRVGEMRRKIAALPWARAAYDRWRDEAETVLHEKPVFARGEAAERSSIYTDSGHYRQFDPLRSDRMWDPDRKEFVAPAEKAWLIIQHERLRRLICSMGFLWQLSGDERYARWAWEGLQDLTAVYEMEGAKIDVSKDKYRYVYGGLYESQSQLMVVEALELLGDAPGHEADVARVRTKVVTPGCEALVRWMDVMKPFNMTVWGVSALAEAGRYTGRSDWLGLAMTNANVGVARLLTDGLRRHAQTGKPDGLWFEHSPFYSCFYVVTPMLSIVRAAEKAGAMNADLRERFRSCFDAPPHLADSELRLLALADRVGPGMMRLTEMREIYEYAAGQVDPRLAPLLSLLYARSGAPRVSLVALAYGPDELPAPAAPETLTKSCLLPEAGIATFRASTPCGAATLWFANPRRYLQSHQGHHHMDALAISLHALGEIITSDLGCPLKEEYLGGTLSHNTLMLDECDQGAVETLSFTGDMSAAVPWARGSFRGNTADKGMWGTFRDFHHGRLQEKLYDDAVITRTVWFDYPYVVVKDELNAQSDKRFDFVFHARGKMVVRSAAAEGLAPLNLPALPDSGAWSCFTNRVQADPVTCLVADWQPRSDIYLRSVTVSDGSFDATWGATPDNPTEILRGSIVLRAPGKQRTFLTVLEVHPGTTSVRAVEAAVDGGVRVSFHNGTQRTYR